MDDQWYKKGGSMKKQNDKNNFAKKYWKNFEELVIALLNKKFRDKNIYQFYIHETPSQSDGGYDGIIFIEPPNNLFEQLKELYTILAEAKLRKNENKDLPLSDFAKTLIIAINRSAAEVYIYTNLHFSLETYRRVNQFSNATLLNVKLIDIFALCDELSTYSDIQTDFPDEFIKQLFDSLTIHNIEKRVTYPQENIFENKLPKLVGDYRNDKLEEYTEYCRENCGVFIVTGIQGSGKTLFIKHIMNLLQNDFNCRLIQLEKFTTIKEFFIYLLSLIWNVDVIDIYNLTKENIDEITLYIPEQYFPRRVKLILLNILGDLPSEYVNRLDIFEEHLIEYLYYIFKPICKRKKQIFAFTNFEKCTDNILNFTNKFIRKFSTENIIIITELRSDITRYNIYIEEWSLLNSKVKPLELFEFNRSEYNQYIDYNYPERNKDYVENLFTICYPLPIYIDNLISIIDDNNLETLLSRDEINIKKLYNNDKFRSKLIIYSVSNYFKDKDIFCIRLAYMVVFFDGDLSFDNIGKIGSDYLEAAYTLADSAYFDIEKNKLQIHHIIYLKAFQDDIILGNYEYYNLISLLYNIIDSFEMDNNLKEIKKLLIAIDLKEKDYVSQNWERICNNLIIHNDFTCAKKILNSIFDKELINKDKKLRLINNIIKCYLGLNEYNSKNLSSFIVIGESLQKNSTINEWILFCYLKSKYNFSLGKYHSIIEITNPYRNEDPVIRYIRALSIKHIYGIDSCLLSLKRGQNHFPKDWYLKYAYLDHLHSKYEKIDNLKAWNYLIQIEKYYDKLSLEDQMHFQYNKIALELYITQTPNIEACKDLICKTFENILPVEMGRSQNLLGQVYYLYYNVKSAIIEFEKALNTLNKNIHITYIYIPLINLALLYDELNDSDNCIKYAIEVLNNLEKFKKEKILYQLSNYKNKIIIEKECAAFILSMELIRKNDNKIFMLYQSKFPEYCYKTHSSLLLPQYYKLSGKFTFRC